MPWSRARQSHPRRRNRSPRGRAARLTIASREVVSLPDPVPLYDQVYAWLASLLSAHGYPKPLIKRLALLVTGLLVGQNAALAGIAESVKGLGLSSAQEPSIVRRLQRTVSDCRLDPSWILRIIFRSLLPTLLASARAAHAANQGLGAAQHAQFVAVRLVLDATTKTDQAHCLTVGLAYQGFVLPLAVRVWEQNVPRPDDQYFAEIESMLSEVHEEMPPELRDHLLLLADRGFGSPRMLDLARTLNWRYVLRVQNQTTVRMSNGRTLAMSQLAAAPGRIWVADAAKLDDGNVPIAAFKTAGWRAINAVAVWLDGEGEPWLLLTNLDASLGRMYDYAQRWAIERLFLSWKSHGFDLEHTGRIEIARLRHLLTSLVLATVWLLATGVPVVRDYLRRFPRRTHREGYQYSLLSDDDPPDLPWWAKFSVFTWGRKTLHETDIRRRTPELCWAFPDWDAPRLSLRFLQNYAVAS